MIWFNFHVEKGSHQKLPDVKKYVLCKLKSNIRESPDAIVLGYLKYAAGDKNSPNFITPGAAVLGAVFQWSDCLPDDFVIGVD